MTDYAAFAADYEGDERTELDSTFGEDTTESLVLGDVPPLDDASWDSMMNVAYDAPAGANSDLLAEFASSITGGIDDIAESFSDLFHGFEDAGDAGADIDDAWDDDPTVTMDDDVHHDDYTDGHDSTDDSITETDDDFGGPF